MKKTKLLTVSFLALVLCACGGGNPTSSASSEPTSLEPTSQAETSEEKTFNIGVCQLVTHEALDAATRGFVETLQAELGDRVNIEVKNAAGEPATCSTIANDFVSKNVDLIMANATPALQAASQSTDSIPVLGTSITEYGVALDIDNFDGTTGFNVSGTSDLAPLETQAQMLVDVFPNVEKVGLLYCSAEANSKYQVEVVANKLHEFNIQTEEIKFSDSNDIASILNGKINSVGAIYIPTDNTAASNSEIIGNICLDNNVPVFAGEEGLCKGCGAITLSISYYNIGVKTARMALDILLNGADITKMPVGYDENPVKKYNPQICTELGLTVPEDYIAIDLGE